MHVLVAGSHGQVGQHITRLPAESDRDAREMGRDEAQQSDIENLGAEPVVADLTEDVTHAFEGCDAIVFAAGSGNDLTYTIVRPASLTNEAGTGRIRAGADLDREDVGRTLVTIIPMESTHGRTFEILAGDEPTEAALESPLNGE